MKIIIVSDSHGNKDIINKLYNQNNFDYFIFLGDIISDVKDIIHNDNVLYVPGNCDFFSKEQEVLVKKLGGYKFIICHGHTFGVKNNINKLVEFAKSNNADFCLFGHTHIPLIKEVAGVQLINPGSVSKPREGEPTYCVLKIIDGKSNIERIAIY